MRDFFINMLEKLTNVLVVLMIIAIVIAALGVAFANSPLNGIERLLAFLGILIGGGLYLILMAGFMYLGLGIYQNTRRTAEALERR